MTNDRDGRNTLLSAVPSKGSATAASSPAPSRPVPRARRSKQRSRRARLTLVVIAALFATFSAVTEHLFVFPATGMPTQVDAIVVPGGPGGRLNAALELAHQDRARYLVLSEGGYVPPRLCGTHVGSAVVLCFTPDPDTTQGEAEAAARLARKYGWRSVAVLTTPDQAWRAELRFRRCYSGSIYGVTTPLPLRLWPLKIAYQWAATAKAELVNRGCLRNSGSDSCHFRPRVPSSLKMCICTCGCTVTNSDTE